MTNEQPVAAEDQAWDDKLVPVAKLLFKAIAAAIENAPMSVVSKKDGAEWAKPIVGLALEQMLAADLRVRDDVMLLQLMIQPISDIIDRVKSSIDMNYDRAVADTFGAENAHAITMKQVHEVLLGNHPTNLPE